MCNYTGDWKRIFLDTLCREKKDPQLLSEEDESALSAGRSTRHSEAEAVGLRWSVQRTGLLGMVLSLTVNADRSAAQRNAGEQAPAPAATTAAPQQFL